MSTFSHIYDPEARIHITEFADYKEKRPFHMGYDERDPNKTERVYMKEELVSLNPKSKKNRD